VLDFFMYWVDLLGNDDGTNPSPPPDWTYYCAVEVDDKFLLGGRTGMLVDSVRDEEDDDYLYWFTADDSVRNWLWDINRVGDLMVTVGDHATVLTSRDGALWNLEVMPESATASILLGVGGTTNLLVAVGNHGQLLTSHNSWTNVVTQNDLGQSVTNKVNTIGVVWEAVDPKPTENDLQGVAALGEMWVVTGGKGTVLTTSDGKQWSKHQAPTTVSSSPRPTALTGPGRPPARPSGFIAFARSTTNSSPLARREPYSPAPTVRTGPSAKAVPIGGSTTSPG
jgi:hypothetical protein